MLADTGLWYALFDTKDSYYVQAREKADYLERCHIILPWPILYETLSTRFVRNTKALRLFERVLKSPHVIYLEDAPYRQAAFDLCLKSSLTRSRALSLVDCAIRLILEDASMKIDYLITFNPRDFADVCRVRGIELV